MSIATSYVANADKAHLTMFEQVQKSTGNAANAVGNKIHLFVSTINDLAFKVINLIRPLFIRLAYAMAHSFGRAREFVLENKQATSLAVVLLPILAIIGFAACFSCSPDPKPEPVIVKV